MSLGPHIRARRQQLGISQRVLATAVGVDVSYLSKIENERLEHTPSSRILRTLAESLDLDEMDMLHRAGKLPGFLAPFAGQAEASAFFRSAAEAPPSPDTWRRLRHQLEGDRP